MLNVTLLATLYTLYDIAYNLHVFVVQNGILDTVSHSNALKILLKMGEFFQIQVTVMYTVCLHYHNRLISPYCCTLSARIRARTSMYARSVGAALDFSSHPLFQVPHTVRLLFGKYGHTISFSSVTFCTE